MGDMNNEYLKEIIGEIESHIGYAREMIEDFPADYTHVDSSAALLNEAVEMLYANMRDDKPSEFFYGLEISKLTVSEISKLIDEGKNHVQIS